MWFKGAGALLLFFTGTLAGCMRGQRAQRRALLLEEMVRFLHAVQANLRYRRDRTQDLLMELCAQTKLPFVLTASPQPFPQRLDAALTAFELSAADCLTPAELGRFRAALVRLGATGAAEEDEQLAYAAALLGETAQAARAQAKTEQKLYRALGMAGGAAAALLVV